MSYLRYIPVICVIGAVIGAIAVTQLWIHATVGFDWTRDLTGLDLMGSALDGFQKYLPMVVCVLSVLAAVVAVATMTVRGFWFGIFICLILGIVIMVTTTMFSMWDVGGERIVHFVDIGFWLSYAAGGLILLGAAVQYSMMFIKPVKASRRLGKDRGKQRWILIRECSFFGGESIPKLG